MNIPEAVVAANRSILSTVIVRCRLQAPPGWAAGERLNTPVKSARNDANTFDKQLNSAYRRSSAKIILFHFTREIK